MLNGLFVNMHIPIAEADANHRLQLIKRTVNLCLVRWCSVVYWTSVLLASRGRLFCAFLGEENGLDIG